MNTGEKKVTFAFPFSYESAGRRLVETIQEVCRKREILGKPAKMGAHATIIPPFYCTEREMLAMAILSRHLWLWNRREVPVVVTGCGVFKPAKPESNIGALYLALEVPEEYRRYVEKHKVSWLFEFVYEPAMNDATDRVWIPHISVIEGEGLHEKALPDLPALNQYVSDRVVMCGEPLLFVEEAAGNSKRWNQVLV